MGITDCLEAIFLPPFNRLSSCGYHTLELFCVTFLCRGELNTWHVLVGDVSGRSLSMDWEEKNHLKIRGEMFLIRTLKVSLMYSAHCVPYPFARISTASVTERGSKQWDVQHLGARNQEQTRGRIGPQLRLGNLRVGELHFCPLCTALDQASSLSRKLAYVPGPTFGFVKLLASSGSHCTKWADEQHRQAGFESRLVPDLPLPFIPTLIGLRAFDLVSSRVWWEAATNIGMSNIWEVMCFCVGRQSEMSIRVRTWTGLFTFHIVQLLPLKRVLIQNWLNST